MYYTTTHPSPVGLLTLASDGENLIGLWLAGQKYHGGTITGSATVQDTLPIFTLTKDWLAHYFAGHQPEAAVIPLAPIGTSFRQGVWRILQDIPYGTVLTYSDIARQMAAAMNRAHMSAQAVGGAVGHNPISIIIPCHRVIGTGGSLTGYAGGIDTKKWLLELEGVRTDGFYTPVKGTAL